MIDLSTIRVIPFCGKSDEWPIWSEKFMAKAKRYGFKDVLTGKLSIPKVDEEFDEDSVTGKKMKNAIEVNELAYTELLLSIDVKTSFGKVVFNIVRGCKSKDYPDGNATTAWEKLKNKYEPTSAPSMVKLDKQFRDSSLKKGEVPETWITQLEDISVRLEEMGLEISEKQFMIHVLNNVTSDYDLQVVLLLERRIGDEKDPLTVSEIRSELSLWFERLNNHSNNGNGKASDEMAFFGGQFKGKCINCGKIGHKSFQCKNQGIQNGGSNGGNASGSIYCTYCRKHGHVKQNCLKLKRKDSRLNNTNNNSSSNGNNTNRDRQNFESQDMVFAATSDAEEFDDNIWICDSGASSHYCVSDRGMFDVKHIDEKIRVGNGNLLVATKIGIIKLNVTQVKGTNFTITLQGVKFVPDLWVDLFSINQALKKGYSISNNDIIISLNKGLNKITFDRFFKAKDGTFSGILMKPCGNPFAYTVLNGVTKKGIEINDFHTMIQC
jgi:gag-polypeptide of LTR copia-type